jgi:hypothetical protein
MGEETEFGHRGHGARTQSSQSQAAKSVFGEERGAEIEEETNATSRESKVGEHLRIVNSEKFVDSLEFNHHTLAH